MHQCVRAWYFLYLPLIVFLVFTLSETHQVKYYKSAKVTSNHNCFAFRLLKFFFQNSNKTIKMEEILSVSKT